MQDLRQEQVCIALGYFDSVHIGHRAIIAATKALAQKLGVGCAVATFSNNAYKLFNPDEKQVYTFAERCTLLSDLCDYILHLRFDARLKHMSAENFLNSLTSHYNIKGIVCGYDYLFGARAKGDVELLKKFCAEHNIVCEIVPEVLHDGVRVSTTRVKSLLRAGKIEQANEFLHSPFMLSGKVVHGRGAGRMFDIPTANIKFAGSKILPKQGVYGTRCVIAGKEYYGATNIGARPTFELSKPAVETMLCDFNDNIYDKDITLYFYKFLRPVKKFDNPAQLSAQVHKDIWWHKHD